MKFIKNTAGNNQKEDAELIAEYKNTGNLDSLGSLYNKYMHLVFGVCLNYFKDEELSKDAVMQIFEELVSKLRVYEVQNFKSWLHVLTRNHCLMALRKSSKQNNVSIDETFVENTEFVHLDIANTKETQLTIMEKCMETLPEEQRKSVDLFYLQEKCYKEVADITGYDMLKVKSYIQNGKRNLKICIEKIVVNNDWLDIDVLEDYLDGKLDAKGMHFVERQALEDPFVAEALEGLKQSPKRKQTLSILQKQLYDRVAEKPIRRKMWGITTQRLSIAATATVAFIAVSILFFMRETSRKNAEIAARKSNGVVVDVLPKSDLAAAKEKQAETTVSDGVKSTVIDKAIVDAKSGDLAKNMKVPSAQKNATVAAAVADNLSVKAESKMASPEAVVNSVAPVASKDAVAYSTSSLSNNGLVYSGNVISQNGQPVSGAVVKVAGTKAVTSTNSRGFFSLPVDSTDKNKEILVKAQGFDDKTVTTDPEAIRMALSGNLSLNEIAAITRSKGKATPIPAPKIVLKAIENLDKNAAEINKPIPVSTVNYTQYLESNNKLYNSKGPEQFVILSFKVKKNGRPSNVTVVKSLNKNADAEAKRLVLAGPDWVLPKKGTNNVELSIKF